MIQTLVAVGMAVVGIDVIGMNLWGLESVVINSKLSFRIVHGSITLRTNSLKQETLEKVKRKRYLSQRCETVRGVICQIYCEKSNTSSSIVLCILLLVKKILKQHHSNIHSLLVYKQHS